MNEHREHDPFATDEDGQEQKDRWQDVEYAACYIDTVTHNPKDRIQYDDNGNLLNDGRPQPLAECVADTLGHLLESFDDALDPNEDWPAYATRNLIFCLGTAIMGVDLGHRDQRRRLGARLARELGLALAPTDGASGDNAGAREGPSKPQTPRQDGHRSLGKQYLPRWDLVIPRGRTKLAALLRRSAVWVDADQDSPVVPASSMSDIPVRLVKKKRREAAAEQNDPFDDIGIPF